MELGKRHILDTLASIVACSRLEPARAARRFATFNSGPSGTVHILGSDRTATLLDAIFANAMTAHAAEINDFHPWAYIQPGPPIVSTVFSIGETINATGEQALRAVITGYEIASRFPMAAGIDNLQEADLSPHGFGPTFGAAAAAASLLRIPQDRVGHVFAYCVQQASGSYQWLRDVEHMEKAFLFSGMPARDGAYAALLVDQGLSGVSDPFDGILSWFFNPAFIGSDSDMDLRLLTQDLGVEFALPQMAYKRYPVGGPTQAGVQGLLELIEEVDRNQITAVRIEMPGTVAVFEMAGMPALNLPYLAALILVDGELDFVQVQSLQRMTTDAAIQEKMKLVEMVHDPEQESEPRSESARVTVTLQNGETRSVFVDHVLGFPDHPMDGDEVQAKALELMTPVLGEDKSSQLAARVRDLEKLNDVNELIPLLTP
jgi:2-methylcitrate dehydratase PrpD